MKLECFRNAARSFAKNRGSLGLAIVMLFAGIAANSVMAGPAQDTNTAQSGSAKFERSFALAAGGTIAGGEPQRDDSCDWFRREQGHDSRGETDQRRN